MMEKNKFVKGSRSVLGCDLLFVLVSPKVLGGSSDKNKYSDGGCSPLLFSFFTMMNKKVYLAPIFEIFSVQTYSHYTGSTNATIPDAGWGDGEDGGTNATIPDAMWGDSKVVISSDNMWDEE